MNFPGNWKIDLKILANYFFPAGCIMWGGAVNRQPDYRARNLAEERITEREGLSLGIIEYR